MRIWHHRASCRRRLQRAALLIALKYLLPVVRMLLRYEGHARAVILLVSMSIQHGLAIRMGCAGRGRVRRRRGRSAGPECVHRPDGFAGAFKKLEDFALGEAGASGDVRVDGILEVTFL